MPAKILSGKLLATEILDKLAKEITICCSNGQRAPCLAVILVGDAPASILYVKNKQTAAKEIGILSFTYNLPITTTEQELIAIINNFNLDPNIDGILVQLPLPRLIDPLKIVEAITPNKDVDGFHPLNIGKLAQGHPLLRPCTPAGVMLLLEQTGIPLAGLHAVVVGASNIVGKPMALELLNKKATVTVCHSKTTHLSFEINQADILIAAAGSANLIKGSWLKPGAIVIDVGINRLENGKLVGDVEFEHAKNIASWITPVPGGVGPMTIAMLLQNTLIAYQQATQHNKTI